MRIRGDWSFTGFAGARLEGAHVDEAQTVQLLSAMGSTSSGDRRRALPRSEPDSPLPFQSRMMPRRIAVAIAA